MGNIENQRAWVKYWPVAVAAAGYVVLAALYLRAADWNFSYFVHFRPDYHVTQHYGGESAGLWVKSIDVHDGVAYYAIAREPFNLPVLREILDAPITRYRRILYPLLVSAFSLGNFRLIPAMMIAVNVLAILASGLLLQRLIAPFGANPAWLLAYYFHPGMVFSFLYDLPTAVALLGMLGGIWWYQQGKLLAAAVSISLAVLAWEVIAAPLAAGLLAYELMARPAGRRRTAALLLVLPLAVAAAWQLVLHRLFPGQLTAQEVVGNFGYPGVGWWQAWQYIFGQPLSLKLLFQFLFLTLTALGGILALGYWFVRFDLYSTLAAVQVLWLSILNARSNILWPSELMRKSLGLWLAIFLLFAVSRVRSLQWWILGMVATTALVFTWLPLLELPSL